jgi:hypothetical protein
VGGSAVAPHLRQGDGAADPKSLTLVADALIPSIMRGKNLLFVAHGFNVSRADGAFALGTLDGYLQLTAANLFIGILWPGDSWIPIVDYPFEGNVAIATGRFLADFCDKYCAEAQSLSFASHSLGARVVLEAVVAMRIEGVRSICLTAGAINRDCLTQEYAGAAAVTDRISLLASDNDLVLRLAFGVGDPFADLLHSDHALFEAALGYKGPATPAAPPVEFPWQIPEVPPYRHGSYLPSSTSASMLWQKPAEFIKRSFLGLPRCWP